MAKNILSATVLAFFGAVTSVASAQDASAEAYGQGVHAYFSGDYADAVDMLSEAISDGTKDPRAYYFRGLASIKDTGDESAGDADFKKGADYEAAGEAERSLIGNSLQRVQGSVRLTIESQRRLARREMQKRRDAYNRARYEATRADEGSALRDSGTDPTPETLPDDIAMKLDHTEAPRPRRYFASPKPVQAPAVAPQHSAES